MSVEFRLEPTGSSSDTARLSMMYDGSGRRISKTFLTKSATAASWETAQVTHYTGIGTEIRENYAGPAKQTKVVVNMPVFFRVTLTRMKPRSYIEKDILRLSNGGAILPKQSFGASRQGLGRYGIEDAENPDMGSGAGYIPNTKFEWYLKNHLGSTMLVYGTQADANPAHSDIGTTLAAYDYRAFGEMVELLPPPTGKVTENFTGSRFTRRTQRTACKSIAEPKNLGAKRNEHDNEIALNYFGARYLDPMLGMWTSVDLARQFASPYLYAGNGYNPVNVVDPDGNYSITQVDDRYVSQVGKYHYRYASLVETGFYKVYDLFIPGGGLMTSSKPDREIENSLRPSVRSGLFGAILDALTFIPFLRPASIPLSASEKTLKEVKNFNDLYSIITLDNVFFEDFMNQLTSGCGIFGSSVENVKVKANWANAYGRKLYDNDVEVTDEVKRQFRDAYKKEFESSDK